MRNLKKFTHAPSQMLSGTQQTDLNFSCGPLYLFLAIWFCLLTPKIGVIDMAKIVIYLGNIGVSSDISIGNIFSEQKAQLTKSKQTNENKNKSYNKFKRF